MTCSCVRMNITVNKTVSEIDSHVDRKEKGENFKAFLSLPSTISPFAAAIDRSNRQSLIASLRNISGGRGSSVNSSTCSTLFVKIRQGKVES